MRKKLSFRLTIAFLIILLIQFSFIYGFPDWTFTKTSYVNSNKFILYFSIVGMLLSLLTLLKTPKELKVFFGIIFILFFSITLFLEVNPIDTTSQPVDKRLLSTSPDNNKLIVRERINAKTNAAIFDTVLVKDFGIFRRIFQK